MYDELHLPETELARAAYDFARATHPEYLFNHSVRSYLYAREIGKGTVHNAEVLFLGCVLHDAGLTVSRGQRFEVDGADEARRFLLERGASADTAEVVWQAIALHTSVGIAGRMRPEIALVQAGSGADVLGLHQIPGDVRGAAEERLPWLDLASSITAAIVERARVDPRTAPPMSFPGQIVADCADGARVPGWGDLLALALAQRDSARQVAT